MMIMTHAVASPPMTPAWSHSASHQPASSGRRLRAVARHSHPSSEGLQEYPLWWAWWIIGRGGRGSGSATSSLWTILQGDLPVVAQRR